jgi:hypothetical protein
VGRVFSRLVSLRALINRKTFATEGGVPHVLRARPAQVRRVLKVTDLLDAFEIGDA